MNSPSVQQKTFLSLLVCVSLAFLAVLWPFYDAVFWAVVLAILFTPLQRHLLLRLPGHPNLVALLVLGLCLVLVILPMTLLSLSLIEQASHIYDLLRSGQLDLGAYFKQIFAALPTWAVELLARFELTSMEEVQRKLSTMAVQASQLIATRALNIGQNTFQFLINLGIMLYLLFFLLRDGAPLLARLRDAAPLNEGHKRHLATQLTTVIRATVKGNVMVAASQGMLGGFIFAVLGIQGAVLWGVLMAFLSLLPAVGAGLIWGPVALYFLATGATGKALILAGFGIGVIGLVDNLLRPILVGKDTKMPDYVVLISTLGGMALLGLNGFVIGPLIAALFMATWDIFSTESGNRLPPP